jgi:hypothetical protein
MKLEQLATLTPIPVDVSRQYILKEDGRAGLQAAAGTGEEEEPMSGGLSLSGLSDGLTATTVATGKGTLSMMALSQGGVGGSNRGGKHKVSKLMPKLQLPTHAQMLTLAAGGGLQGGTLHEREQHKKHLAAASMEVDPAANSSDSIWHRLSVRQVCLGGSTSKVYESMACVAIVFWCLASW